VVGEASFYNANITGMYQWRDMGDDHGAILNLEGAHVGNLDDEEDDWPAPGNLFLDGFTYDRIDSDATRGAAERIEWLRRTPITQFSPQPYTQLAKVFQESGREDQAKQVLIALENDRKERTGLTRGELVWYYVGWTIGYGQRPWRALWISLAIMVLGAVVFGSAANYGLMMPEDQMGTKDDAPNGGWKRDSRMNSILYSVDAFIPLVSFHQTKYWLPDPMVGGRVSARLGEEFTWGCLCRCYLWFHIAMGWLLSTLLAVGLSGLVSR
jgi:hypothetical protein